MRGTEPTTQTALDATEGRGASPLIDAVIDWLTGQALGSTELETLIDGCCERLTAAGVPLWRAHFTYTTLHPLFASVSLTWRRGKGVEREPHAHEETLSDRWLSSPLYYLIDKRLAHLRRRLAGKGALLDFPMLGELRELGGTDYLAYVVPFVRDDARPYEDGVAGSWATDQPEGFGDRDVAALLLTQRALAVAGKVQIRDQVARNVLSTYLGHNAGGRVLDGQIRRGDGERIEAVIWYSDLRGSTPLADNLPADEFLHVLNSYFECTAGAVIAQGGEVLRFVGDAVLGIFPLVDGALDRPAQAALDAALDARRRLAAVNVERSRSGGEALAFGVALHAGEVLFGNIGVPERLEFSVTGPAANEAARLEGLTKTLGVDIALSERVAASLGAPLDSLGRHRLRGVGAEIEVFTPDARRRDRLTP